MAERLVVIGQGYVGLPLAVRAVEVGYNVIGIDRDSRRVKQLGTGVLCRRRPRPAARVRTQQRTLRPCSDFAQAAGFDISVIAVPTPSTRAFLT